MLMVVVKPCDHRVLDRFRHLPLYNRGVASARAALAEYVGREPSVSAAGLDIIEPPFPGKGDIQYPDPAAHAIHWARRRAS